MSIVSRARTTSYWQCLRCNARSRTSTASVTRSYGHSSQPIPAALSDMFSPLAPPPAPRHRRADRRECGRLAHRVFPHRHLPRALQLASRRVQQTAHAAPISPRRDDSRRFPYAGAPRPNYAAAARHARSFGGALTGAWPSGSAACPDCRARADWTWSRASSCWRASPARRRPASRG